MATILTSGHKVLSNLISELKVLEGYLSNTMKSYERMLELQKIWSQSYDMSSPLLEHACLQLLNLFNDFVSPGWRNVCENINLQRKSFQQLLEAERRLDNVQTKLETKRKEIQRSASTIRLKEESVTSARNAGSTGALDEKKWKQKHKKLLKRKASLSKLECKVASIDANYNSERLRTRQMRLDNFHYALKAFSSSHLLLSKRLLMASQAQQRMIECIPVTPSSNDKSVNSRELYRRLGEIVSDTCRLWEQPGGIAVRCLCDCHTISGNSASPATHAQFLPPPPPPEGAHRRQMNNHQYDLNTEFKGVNLLPSAPIASLEFQDYKSDQKFSKFSRSSCKESKTQRPQVLYPSVSLHPTIKKDQLQSQERSIMGQRRGNPFGYETQYSPDILSPAQTMNPFTRPP